MAANLANVDMSIANTNNKPANLIDLDNLAKRARHGPIVTAEEFEAVLGELAQFRALAAYLASCHAGSLEVNLAMRRGSKKERRRLRTICDIAARGLSGSAFAAHFYTDVNEAARRCKDAADVAKADTAPPRSVSNSFGDPEASPLPSPSDLHRRS